MKSIFTGILFSVFFLTTTSYGQDKPETVKDSITVFYNDLLNNLESNYLNRKDVDWNKIKAYALENALKAKDFGTSLKTTTIVFDTIKCNHCQLFSDKGFYSSTLNKPLSISDFSKEFVKELEKRPSFDVKLINKNIGYINMPGMLMINLSQDSLNLETQKMYDKIVELKKSKKIKGWVLDLRFNGGGNVFPMLAALHSLLGDTIVYNAIDNDGVNVSTQRLKNGAIYSNEELQAKVSVSIKPDINIPVAIIVNRITGSSGEDILVAFKNRKNVVFIGDRSNGLLTGNKLIELLFDAKIALTTSYIVDTNNEYREYFIPDIKVIKKDNFEDLSKDENIIKAVEFFETIKE